MRLYYFTGDDRVCVDAPAHPKNKNHTVILVREKFCLRGDVRLVTEQDFYVRKDLRPHWFDRDGRF